MDEHALRESARRRLRALAGPSATLREDQWTAIRTLVIDRGRALVVQRTGWGKSAVYFIATALLRERHQGPTVIVSPLLALMRNQVEAATRAGIHAVTMNSANTDDWRAVEERVTAGTVDVLLVSPERLNNPDFRDNVLPALTRTAGLLVIDEAHCVSDWGHDFRPDYRRIRTLLTELPPGVPVLATTATANDRVIRDISEQLGPTTGTVVSRGPLDRTSLRLSVLTLPTAAARLAWLADHLDELPGSGIIYTLTVAATNDVTAFLRERGLTVAAYSGRTDNAERQQAEDDLLNNRVKALIATSALGMGFDKPDLGFVVHLGAPSSPIAYYQQIGRAGRGVDRAEVLLLPGPEDRDIWAYFTSLAFPREQVIRRILSTLSDTPMSTAALEPFVELSRSRLEIVLKVLDVDGAVRRVRGGWIATGQRWSYDQRRYERLAAARAAEQQAMLDYQGITTCRMEFLLRQLDDPHAAPCGRCDNCRGGHWPVTISESGRAAADQQISRPGVEIAPRKMWPTGMSTIGVSLSGRIPGGESVEAGRAIGRLTDIGWGTRLRAVLDGADQPVPDDLFNAGVRVLAAWDWARRPVGVIALGSHSHPTLITGFAERIAAVGRLPMLGRLWTTKAPSRANSARRVAGLLDDIQLPDIADVTGPVLLIDDRVDTGWTMTIAGRELRRAGVPAVLPFALATTT